MRLKYSVWIVNGDTRFIVPHIAWAWLGLTALENKKLSQEDPTEIVYTPEEKERVLALVKQLKFDASMIHMGKGSKHKGQWRAVVDKSDPSNPKLKTEFFV